MATTEYDIPGIDLSDDHYEVEQALIRSKYKAMDDTGNVVLRSKKKKFKLKEEFPFVDGDGNEVFTVKAGGILDIAGDYTIVTPNDDQIITLDANYQIFGDTWKIRDPTDERLLATIESKSTVADVLRSIHSVFAMIPHKYEITDPDGTHVGSIDGQFSMKDRYDVNIDDASTVPREPIVAAAMVIDAIEGN